MLSSSKAQDVQMRNGSQNKDKAKEVRICSRHNIASHVNRESGNKTANWFLAGSYFIFLTLRVVLRIHVLHTGMYQPEQIDHHLGAWKKQ